MAYESIGVIEGTGKVLIKENGQFSDVAMIETWAKDGVAWALANGLMHGFEGVLNPSGNITRAEVAVMLFHFDKL